MNQRKLVAAAGLVVLTVTAIGGLALYAPGTSKPPMELPAAAVPAPRGLSAATTAVTVAARQFFDELRTDATLVLPGDAPASVLMAEVAGRLERSLPPVGTRVRKGQVLGYIDDADQRAKTDEMRADVARLVAQHRDADATRVEYEGLAAKDFVSPSQLRAVQRDAQSLTQQVAAAQARLRQVEVTAEHARLVAPSDGVVAASPTVAGQYVRAGDQLLELVPDVSPELVLNIPQEWFPRVANGAEVRARLPGQDSDTTFRLMRVQPRMGANMTFKAFARATTPLSGAAAQPGLALSARLLTRPMERLAVPEAAVRLEGRRQYVFVLENGKARRQDVERLADMDGWVAVAGLRSGETVAVSGAGLLREGQAVVVTAAADAAGGKDAR